MMPCRAALAFLVLVPPATAAETAWQEVMPEVRIRLVSADRVTPEGLAWVALEVQMPQGTKTYWRLPGESGIPTSLDFAGSPGVAGHAIHWPFPQRETDKGYLDHAYYGHLVLPVALSLDPAAPGVVELTARAVLGVCDEICVPVSADFALSVDFSAPDRAQEQRIRQARALVPVPREAGPEELGAVRFDADAKSLVIEGVAQGFPLETLIADIPGRSELFGPAETDAAGGVALPLLGRAPAEGLSGARVHLTFMEAEGPAEVVREITAP